MSLYQRTGSPNWTGKLEIDNTLEISGATGPDGRLLLTNRSVGGTTTTRTGHTLHDNPFGMRLTTLMIGKKVADSAVPMSLLAEHPNVQFNFYRPAIGTCEAEMH